MESKELLETIERPGYVDFDSVHSNGHELIRAQAGFHANGCEWRQKLVDAGKPPCFMYCAWPELASTVSRLRESPINDQEFISQTDFFIQDIHQKNRQLEADGSTQRVERAEFYIGGSHLNPNELNPAILETIYRNLAKIPSVREIGIEARMGELKDEKLEKLDQLAAETGTTCIIEVGVETTNPILLKKSKKGLSRGTIQRGVEKIFNRENLQMQVYFLQKPGVMNDEASIKQSLEDLQFLADVIKLVKAKKGKQQKKIFVNMAPLSAMEGTGAHLNDAYEACSLWNIIEIIKRLPKEQLDHIDLFFGLNTEVESASDEIKALNIDDEVTSVLKKVTSCASCEEDVLRIIKNFNKTQDPSVLGELPDCDCENEWEKQKDRPFFIGRVKAPVGDDPFEKALFEEMAEGIMEVEGAAFDPRARASWEMMIKRMTSPKSWSLVAYDSKGELTAYLMSERIKTEDLEKIPIEERGWDRLIQVPPSPDGDALKIVSLGAKANSPDGAARALAKKTVPDFVDFHPEITNGGLGVPRMPGMSIVKDEIENQIRREITEDELLNIARQYKDSHYKRFADEMETQQVDNSTIETTFNINDRQITLKHPVDSNLGLWGRLLYPIRGVVVHSMESDPESCYLGVYYHYPGRNPEKIRTNISSAAEKTLAVNKS
ncbi:hypothetical protein GF354_04595 [Candidatus Peregrinibacteria bacterium]|nr:hypothetical protein [Candidatus Peregrinibacteria bacterium]